MIGCDAPSRSADLELGAVVEEVPVVVWVCGRRASPVKPESNGSHTGVGEGSELEDVFCRVVFGRRLTRSGCLWSLFGDHVLVFRHLFDLLFRHVGRTYRVAFDCIANLLQQLHHLLVAAVASAPA